MVGFLSIYTLFELFGSFSRIVEARPPFSVTVAYFMGYVAPYFMYIAPACLMLATLYTMWNFCRHSELIAMRASGIGFFAIVRPLLFAAALMACFVAWVNECYMPRQASWAASFRSARFKAADMVTAVNIVYHNAAADRTWNVARALDADMTELVDVSIAEDYPNGVRKRTIKAPKAEFLDGQWWFHRPVFLHFNAQGVETPSPTPKHDAMELLPFPSFAESPLDFVLQNRNESHYSVADRLRFVKTHPSMTAAARRRMTYNIWSQALAPLACLVITLFAIPAGIATGRQSVFKGILGALGMFFTFYGISIGCMALAYVGWVPVVPAALAPHVVFLVVGTWMFWRQR